MVNMTAKTFTQCATQSAKEHAIELTLLGHLLAAGVPASRLAYIKPATQCEAPDLLAAWRSMSGGSKEKAA